MLRSLVGLSMENIALWHERDLSNSANERFSLPMAPILLDEMLDSIIKVVSDLKVNKERIVSNIELTKGQIYGEFMLDALIKKGVARFEAYRDIQRVAFSALESGEHLFDAACKDLNISRHLSKQELKAIFDAKNHLAASAKIIDNVCMIIRNDIKRV